LIAAEVELSTNPVSPEAGRHRGEMYFVNVMGKANCSSPGYSSLSKTFQDKYFLSFLTSDGYQTKKFAALDSYSKEQ
jgi:hypothetical protein